MTYCKKIKQYCDPIIFSTSGGFVGTTRYISDYFFLKQADFEKAEVAFNKILVKNYRNKRNEQFLQNNR
jgi:hypothetical protein